MIPQLVGDRDLARANALEGAGYGLASLAGAGLGGLVIGVFGSGGAAGQVAADAASYLVFAGLLLSISLSRPARRDRSWPLVPSIMVGQVAAAAVVLALMPAALWSR